MSHDADRQSVAWNNAFRPLSQHIYPPHGRPKVDYIVRRARRSVPEFGGKYAMSDDQVSALLAGAHIEVERIDTGHELLGILLPPTLFPGRYILGLSVSAPPAAARCIQLHEIAHALGGHFGSAFVDTPGPCLSLAEYPVWEREADLFCAIGCLSAAERGLPASRIRALLLERLPMDAHEWVNVRAPWIAKTMARRASRLNALTQRAA